MRLTNQNCAGLNVPHSAFRIPHWRAAFTLVELMVVMGIIVALAAITLLFLPKREVRLASQGADQLQTYVAAARSRALRDQAPRGIRLVSSDHGHSFREVQLLEVPEPYVPPSTVTMTIPPAAAAAGKGHHHANQAHSTATFSGLADDLTTIIHPGDMLEILQGSGSIHRIIRVHSNSVTLISTVPEAAVSTLTLTNNYRFIRQVRPLMGEPALQLPNTVFVSGAHSYPKVSGKAHYDIVFSPAGQVITASTGKIVLWLTDDNQVSKPTLLAIYAHTGGVAAHPLGPASNPYAYTQDGKSSGQ